MRKRIKMLVLAAAAVIATSLALPAAADAYYGHGFGRFGGFGYPYYGHGYGGFGYGPYGGYGGGFAIDGSVRIEVNPKDAREDIEVYVDGGLAGVVNDYDGALQRLRLAPGNHELELRLDGYQSQKMTIFVERGSTFHIRGELAPAMADEMASEMADAMASDDSM